MNLKLKMHTILVMIGPNQAGKTTFYKNILLPNLKEQNISPVYLSSNDNRDLLNFSKMNNKHHVSAASFSKLYYDVDLFSSYPVNAPFIVIDTKGLSHNFRTDIKNIALKNHYHLDFIVFDFANTREFYNIDKKIVSKKEIEQQVNRLRKDTLSGLYLYKPNKIHMVRHKDFIENPEHYSLTIEDLAAYHKQFLPVGYEYVIISDIHEQLETFKSLLIENHFTITDDDIILAEKYPNKRIIIAGDFIDKGNQTKEIIDFIHKNMHMLYIVIGNHEKFALDYFEDVKNEDTEAIIEKEKKSSFTFYSSIPILKENPTTLKKLQEILNHARTHHEYIISDSSMIHVTHAPCEKKYLGKVDKVSLNKKIKQKTNYSNRQVYNDVFNNENYEPTKDDIALLKSDYKEALSFLEKEKENNEPFHVFGHIAFTKPYRIGNRIGIDTAASRGNTLTSLSISKDKCFFRTIASEAKKCFVLESFVEKESYDKKEKVMTPKLAKKINQFAKNKINYLSGTMSPASQNLEFQELESLSEGLDLFRKKKVSHVILQPKFMGSRANVYLFKDKAQSYLVSRNGNVITHVDFSQIFEDLYSKFEDYMLKNNVDLILLDAELLPWNALGQSLIDKSFKPISAYQRKELELIESLNIESKLLAIAEDKSLAFNFRQISEERKLLSIYDKQLALFDKEKTPPYLEIFDILKIEKNSGEIIEQINNNEEIFNLVSNQDYMVIDLNTENAYQEAASFYNKLTLDKGMEGLVIKPLLKNEVLDKQVPPYLKVRNEAYLTLVYGHDYKLKEKHQKLMKQKNIKYKLKTSIEEYLLNLQLLAIPNKQINKDNIKYQNILVELLGEIDKEQTLDPRL